MRGPVDDDPGRIAAAGSFTIDQGIEVRVTAFTEFMVEDAALAWQESLGFTPKHGPRDRVGSTGCLRFVGVSV